MKKIIDCDNIVKSFGSNGEKRNVLNGVSVGINEGEFVAIMGPSGSGKSTLMFALSGMDEVDSGKVAFDGTELSTLSENELADMRRMNMGFVFQQPTLLKNLSILDNIILPSMRDNRKNGTHITEKARTADGQDRRCRAGKSGDYAGFWRSTPAGGNLPSTDEQSKSYFWR